ncbi:Zn-ribbon domain-containing OB-fold protein [Salinisphaera hydrothermalis]|uniref:DUF35 domain-containing protein n=1 Tax=Salinisphaera hydrothermalis (strain C41B8) TaxID=1304275 RepID=A0A084IGA6_SALHC|nr:OB-fold domain-containing protein [Salinisphaera hydrothermalis]KEZ75740.1 hypothetical protein C41B8_18472 [Salinisphaera hydrothermalis C41B8]
MSDQLDFPVPKDPDEHTYKGFFDGLQKKILRARQCCSCGQWQWPPHRFCSQCQSTEFDWHDIPHRGIVYSYTVMHRAFRDYFADKLPYGVVIVEAGPVHISGRFIGNPASLACGMPVGIAWDDLATKGASPAWQAV